MPAATSKDAFAASGLPTVAVVGLGKIGLPLAVQYAQHGYRVLGCDTNPLVVESLKQGISHVHEESELALEVPRLVQQGRLCATTETTLAVQQAEVVVIIVPVVIDGQQQVDFTHIDAATLAVGAGLQPGTLIVYETTLPVGSTSQHLRALLEHASALQAGKDFYLAYSPERVSSGSIFRDLRLYPKVIGGLDAASTERAATFYRSVLDAEIMLMSSTNEAEFVKLIETTYRDVNIALANEYAQYADAHGLDVRAAITAANTQPYSHIHLPGVGVGGHCIPVYPYFLFANPADEHRYEAADATLLLPRSARRINDGMAEYAVHRLEEAMGDLAQCPILILGVAYRGNVRETAYTSARLLQAALLRRHALVYVDDPLFSESELRAQGYTPLPTGCAAEIRAIIMQADHQDYQSLDFQRFPGCQVVLDGRQALRRQVIEQLGMTYLTIGGGAHGSAKIPRAASPVPGAEMTLY